MPGERSPKILLHAATYLKLLTILMTIQYLKKLKKVATRFTVLAVLHTSSSLPSVINHSTDEEIRP